MAGPRKNETRQMKPDIVQNLLKNYTALVGRVDRHVQQVAQDFSHAIACQKGCDGCCRFLSLFPVEAFALSLAFSCLDKSSKDIAMAALEGQSKGCPLLVQGECLLYPARPIICRTHGFPLVFKKKSQTQVDFCPKNFRHMTSFPKESLLDLDHLNTLLSAINQHFLKSIETQLPSRIPMSQALVLCRDME